MSKTIYEEALLELECLDIDMHDVMQDYIGNYDYDLIHKALEQAQKQEKLLELYRLLFKASGLDLFDTELVRQIKEIENE